MRLLIFGPPGVGKGTQAKLLSERFGVPHISTGEILREAVADGTETGEKAKSVLDAGQLVSDEIMIGIVRDVLESERCKNGLILDGFPRTLGQAKALSLLTEELGIRIDGVINMEIAEQEVIKRLKDRLVCRDCGRIYNLNTDRLPGSSECPECGGRLYQRDDDKPETVHKRLAVYFQSTAPVKKYYERLGLLRTVNAEGNIAEINREILALIDNE